ncbi:MAG: hypothetical protein Q9162_003808 [Coniocarpon cinnabarinum]
MTFTIVIFSWRKPNTTPSEFKTHYETKHLPLIKSLTGSKFPITHTRHYIQRQSPEGTTDDKSNASHPAVTFMGSPDDFDYDAYAELVFEDDKAFQEFFALVSEPGAAKRLEDDENCFIERSKLRVGVVDQSSVTTRRDA